MTESRPFIGERPYGEADAHLFFGRALEVRQARSLWLTQRVVVLHGPEAVGKTSLLQAGVLPALASASADVLPAARLAPGPRLGSGQHADLAEALMRSWTRNEPRQPRHDLTIREFLLERRTGGSRPLLVAIDQFEECLAPNIPRPGQDRLLRELIATLDDIPELNLLLTVRHNFLPELSKNTPLADIAAHYLPLSPFQANTTAVILEEAARVSGMSLASGTVDQLTHDLSTVTFHDVAGNTTTLSRDQVEPLHLQIAGRDLWESRPATARVITGEQIRAWGGVDAALLAFYESAVKEAAGIGIQEASLRDWLRLTFVNELGTRESVRDNQVAMSDVFARTVDYLLQRRVLSADYHDGTWWYQLSHDRLAYAAQAAARAMPRPPTEGDTVPEGPRTAHGMRAMAIAALGKGDLAAASRHAANAVARYQAADDWRGTAGTRVRQADIARAAGDLPGAEQHLRSALSIYLMLEDGYSAARMLTALATLRFTAGDYAAAADLNRQAVERAPGDIAALTGLGYAQWQAGSPADAEATFDQALRRQSDAATALAGRGQIRADQGHFDSGLGDLDRALQSPLDRDTEADARSARALALTGLGRVAEARLELAASLQLDPERPRSRLRAGRMAAILGEPNEMRAEIERALSGHPSLSSVERDSANRLLDTFR